MSELKELKNITQAQLAGKLHLGQADSPDLGTRGMQALFDAHPNLNTDTINENARIQNENNAQLQKSMNLDKQALTTLIEKCDQAREQQITQVNDTLTQRIAFEEEALASHKGNGRNPHQVTKEQVGLGNCDNTSDEMKPASAAVRALLDTKQDRAEGMGLSRNDYSDADKALVARIEDKADTANVLTLDNESAYVPTLPTHPCTKGYADNVALQAGAVSSVFGRAGQVVPLAGDYTAEMVGAAPAVHGHLSGAFTAGHLPAIHDGNVLEDSGVSVSQLVPTARTVNGKALTDDIVLVPSDIGAMSTMTCATASSLGAVKVGENLAITEDGVLSALPSGKKYQKIVIGCVNAGHTEKDVDYLCDGVNDQVEINAALNQLSDGGEVFIREGVYNIGAMIEVPFTYVTLCGNGFATVLKRTFAGSDASPGLIRTAKNYCTFRDFRIAGNASSYSGTDNYGLDLAGRYERASNLFIESCSGYGIYGRSNTCMIQNCTFAGNGYAIGIKGTGALVVGNMINSSSKLGIQITGQYANVTGNLVSGCAQDGISVTGNYNTVSSNTVLQSTLGAGIYLHSECAYNLLSANSCYACMCDGIRIEGRANAVTANLILGNSSIGVNIISGNSNCITGNMAKKNINGDVTLGTDARNNAVSNNVTTISIANNGGSTNLVSANLVRTAN